MPPPMQVKLLRFLQEGSFVPVGGRVPKAAAALRIRTPGVTTTRSVQTIVPYVTGQKRWHPCRLRRTKPELPRYVAEALHALTSKMILLCHRRRPQ
ncbi:hypothetical protein ACQKEU_28950 [Acidovorax sp. NPDC077664]|uniref:hypothetical protein n=1 Tax=Acidovorax sp. NPDC077664 TaxID=3390544 RepID=UPI003D07FC9C